MKAKTATEARNHFPEIMDEVRTGKEAVVIYKNKKPAVVIIDVERFKLLEELEDTYWSKQLKHAMQHGKLLGAKATAKLIEDHLQKNKSHA